MSRTFDLYRAEDRLYTWGFRAGLLIVLAVKVGPVIAWRYLRGGRS